MSGQTDEPESGPNPRLRPVRSNAHGMRWVGLGGGIALVLAVVLVFVAPSPAWFLLYPVLILAGIAALATAVAWMLRYL